jgi:hypothetical protein
MRYAFINSSGIVVQVISGTLTAAQQEMFLRDYATLFGAVAIIEVEDGTSVWIGGAYLDGVFAPPPEPEPEPAPEVIDGTATLMPTEQPIELQEQL